MVYDYENLKKAAQSDFGRAVFERLEKDYKENYDAYSIPVLHYSDFTEVSRSGDRSVFDKKYFHRRKMLYILQHLCLWNDKYIPDLENLLNAICEEYTWQHSAHSWEGKAFNYRKTDLFSAETGFSLSETAHIFKDKLNPDLLERIRKRLYERIVGIFEAEDMNAWPWNSTNNWSAVCACGVGAVYLYQFPERFGLVKEKLDGAMKCFLSGYDKMGATSEGLVYWSYGFGLFSIYYDLLQEINSYRHPVLDEEKTKQCAKFFSRCKLSQNCAVSFSDGLPFMPAGMDYTILGVVQKLFGSVQVKVPPPEEILDYLPNRRAFQYPRMLYAGKYLCDSKPNADPNFYFEDIQLYIKRMNKYSFAAKCGHNAEHHNHNDVGTFIVVKDDKQVLCDIGSGEYTYQYFREEMRYNFFPTTSLSHSVPIINGKAQSPGKQFRGQVLNCNADEFYIDIAKAYDENIEHYYRKFEFEENKIIISDNIVQQTETDVVFRFVSYEMPKLDGDAVLLGDVRLKFPPQLKFSFKKENFLPHKHDSKSCNDFVYCLDFTPEKKVKIYTAVFEILMG